MADPTLYLFDGHNLLHAGSFADQRELTDALASFVAMRGARGVVVWDGAGSDTQIGPLAVLYAPHADAVLERLAAEGIALRADRDAAWAEFGVARAQYDHALLALAAFTMAPYAPWSSDRSPAPRAVHGAPGS